jgi:hypothetical protein
MRVIEMIQAIAARRSITTYLEIGVLEGQVFLRVQATRKFAVDPRFRIGWARKLYHLARRPENLRNRYFEVTSDKFFAEHADSIGVGVDVAFIDGLHRREQVRVDIKNCLGYLRSDGVILVHDCLPPSQLAALPADCPSEIAAQAGPNWTGEWTGDVYRAVIGLRAERHDLDVFVVDCDFGVAVVTRGNEHPRLSISQEAVESMTFGDFEADRERLLNVRSPEYFLNWLDRRYCGKGR